ncbi:MAG: putative DNA binding domain-containing protein [Nitrososphaera sp.]|nr:putative DNA binding domain-containing protein [Nitrososphaera sp.]
MTTEREIKELIEGSETLHVEFKSARAHSEALAAALVSFLNTEGGFLLMGVEDDGQVSGVENVEATRQRLDQILANSIIPRATAYLETVKYGGKDLLKVGVPRGLDRPYQTNKGQCFIRTNTGKRLASREEIRRLYLAVRAFYYDESTLVGTSLGDVDFDVFNDFLAQAYGYSKDETRTRVEYTQLLRNLKAMQGDELTVAGLLFFGRYPQTYLATARIDFARFAGIRAGETITDRKEVGGRLPQQLDGIEQILRIHLLHRGAIREFQPEAQYEIPLEMLREALINALVHRDYSLASPIRVLIFDDRLEIHSPGKLPNGVTVDNIRAGVHVERNPIILSLMAKVGLMTRLGTGILRILRLAKETGLPEPGLVETESEFIVTLYRPKM